MFYIYSLNGCPHSERAEILVGRIGLKHKIIPVKNEMKEKNAYKKKHKMDTFPQIFYKTGSKTIKIGGYSDFFDAVDVSYQICQKDIDTKIVDIICSKLRE